MNKLSILFIGLIVSGCAAKGRDFPIQSISPLKAGLSTRADVEQLFGKPTAISQYADGSSEWMYRRPRAFAGIETYHVTFDNEGNLLQDSDVPAGS
jgi:hypothetical protein